MALGPAYSAHQQLQMVQESLTARESTYIEARLGGTPPNAAARLAGYTNPTDRAAALEKDERIHTCMQLMMRCQAQQAQVTRDDVVAGLLESLNYATNTTELVKAWAEIGKIIGAYAPKQVEMNHHTDPQRMKQMSDEELLAQAGDIVDGEYEPVDFEEPGTAVPESQPQEGDSNG